MRILGAEGLIGGTGQNINEKALDQIDSNYLVDGDCACAKYEGKFWWYVLVDNHGGTENVPSTIRPKVGGNASMRWTLRDTYISAIESDTIYTNNIRPLSGDVINLNDVVTLSGSTFIFEETAEAPFIVYSQIMVNNLNVEYLGGKHWSEYTQTGLIESGDQWISQGVDEVYVPFPNPRYNVTYSLFTELFNIAGLDTSIITYLVTGKTTTGFTVKLSSNTDNSYYRVQWAILGENEEFGEYYLQDVLSDNITDIDNDLLTIT